MVATPLRKELVLARQMPRHRQSAKRLVRRNNTIGSSRSQKNARRCISEVLVDVSNCAVSWRLDTKFDQIRLFNAKSAAQSERPVIVFPIPTRVKRGSAANSLTLKN